MVSAEVLWEKLKMRQDTISRDLGEDESLQAEYLSPTGQLLLIRDVGYYSDIDDLIFLVGEDPDSGEECQTIAPPHAVQIIFRVAKSASKYRKVGFIKE